MYCFSFFFCYFLLLISHTFYMFFVGYLVLFYITINSILSQYLFSLFFYFFLVFILSYFLFSFFFYSFSAF